MTNRDIKRELSYSTYIDMEEGNDTETIDYPSLIHLLTEILGRIETLEKQINQTNPDFTGCYD